MNSIGFKQRAQDRRQVSQSPKTESQFSFQTATVRHRQRHDRKSLPIEWYLTSVIGECDYRDDKCRAIEKLRQRSHLESESSVRRITGG